jgi:hypothetical protein
MTNYLSLKNKYRTIYNQSENNKNNINRLANYVVVNNDISFNKKTQEIILLNKYEMYPSAPNLDVALGWNEFYGLDDVDLAYLHPYCFLETTDAYSDINSWNFTASMWCENYTIPGDGSLNTKTLYVFIRGYIDINSVKNLAPIYVNVKLKVLNPKIFDLLTN